MRSNHFPLFVGLLVSLVALLLAVPAAALPATAGHPPAEEAAQELAKNVMPPAGTPGTLFSFYATGFRDSEKIVYWFNDPQGHVLGEPVSGEYRTYTYKGRADWSWEAPGDAAPGQWVAVARGMESETEVMISFEVLPAEQKQPVYAPINPSNEVGVEPLIGAPGIKFAFFAAGFYDHEKVGFWFNKPDGGLHSNNDAYVTYSYEGRADWTWDSPASAAPGIWTAVAKGNRSGRVKLIHFEIRPLNTATGDTTASAPSDEDLLALSDGVVEPLEEVAGSRFAFFATGFGRRESIRYDITDPAGTEHLDYEDYTTTSNVEGRADWTWKSPADAMPGVWAVTAKGQKSGKKSVIYFKIRDINTPATIGSNPESSAVPFVDGKPVNANNVGVSPAIAMPGDTIAFYIANLNLRDTVRYHLVDPNGRIYHEKEFETGSTEEGRADWTWKSPTDAAPGLWTMVVEAEHTGVRRPIYFQIATPSGEVPSHQQPVVTGDGQAAVFDVGVEPSVARPDDRVAFFATGFEPGEDVEYSVVDPNGWIYEDDEYEVESSQEGRADWQWKVPTGAAFGTWTMIAVGEESELHKEISFGVGDPETMPPPENEPVATIAAPDNQASPEDQNTLPPTPAPAEERVNGPGVGVEPAIGQPDTKMAFFASGFNPRDTVRYYLVDPNGRIYESDDYKAGTSAEGRADWEWKVPTGAAPGPWTMFLEGEHSNVHKTIYFEIGSVSDSEE